MRKSALSLIEKDGRLLCVWNKRFHGWALPGGMVEEGESIWDAQERELLEETGLRTFGRHLVYVAPFDGATRPSQVHIFLVAPIGKPVQKEEGCPLAWLTRDEFLQQTPFVDFYEKAFKSLR